MPSDFPCESVEQLKEAFALRGFALPVSDDLSVLAEGLQIGKLHLSNRWVAQPMEGCDGDPDGTPSDLTVRKYLRLAVGGAGLIWFEACAVVPEGRANPRQLWLHEGNAAAFAKMVAAVRAAAEQAGWPRQAFVLQLTHSGRYCRPIDKPAPVIAHRSGVLDKRHNLGPDHPLVTDAELDALQEAYVRAAVLARQAGFDGVDIKACHGYLLNELLASHTRPGRYGGNFENRTRMLRETMARVRRAVGKDLEVTTRMSGCDAIDYPFGWGVDRRDCARPDLAEPMALVRLLRQGGANGINITIGNPYFNPHVNRPADRMVAGWPEPPEPPLAGMARMIGVVRDIQQAHAGWPVIASGLSYLRQFIPRVSAGIVKQGWAAAVGLGRNCLAYPDFPADVLRTGKMSEEKVCITCSGCTQLMRDGQPSGCVIRDAQVYGRLYRDGRRQRRNPQS